MKKNLIRLYAISLTLTFFAIQSALAATKNEPVCFTGLEVHLLAEEQRRCELLKLNNASTHTALQKALDEKRTPAIENEILIAGSVLGAFLIGFILGTQNKP